MSSYDEESRPYRALTTLWRELSEDERVSLVALAVFARGAVADWAYSYARAQSLVARTDERYQINLGMSWLAGLRRYQSDPPPRA